MDTIWTVVSDGRPIVAFNIENAADAEDARQQAESFVGDTELRGDLMTWRDEDDVPLWDGQSEISIRAALPEEEEMFREVYADAAEDEDFTDDDGFMVFLVPVNDPDEEDDGDDEEDDEDDDEDEDVEKKGE